MKFKIERFAPLAVLLVSSQFAVAQGTSGGNGVVASIPGSVVRGYEQGPGLIGILTGSTPLSDSLLSMPTIRRIRSDAPPTRNG
jgi:hypothetical protein